MITRLIRTFIRLKIVFFMAKKLYKDLGDEERNTGYYYRCILSAIRDYNKRSREIDEKGI